MVVPFAPSTPEHQYISKQFHRQKRFVNANVKNKTWSYATFLYLYSVQYIEIVCDFFIILSRTEKGVQKKRKDNSIFFS